MMAGGREVNQIGMEGRRIGAKSQGLQLVRPTVGTLGGEEEDGKNGKRKKKEKGRLTGQKGKNGIFFCAMGRERSACKTACAAALHVSSALSFSMSSKGIYSSR